MISFSNKATAYNFTISEDITSHIRWFLLTTTINNSNKTNSNTSVSKTVTGNRSIWKGTKFSNFLVTEWPQCKLPHFKQLRNPFCLLSPWFSSTSVSFSVLLFTAGKMWRINLYPIQMFKSLSPHLCSRSLVTCRAGMARAQPFLDC